MTALLLDCFKYLFHLLFIFKHLLAHGLESSLKSHVLVLNQVILNFQVSVK